MATKEVVKVKVVCAWCLDEGKENILGHIEVGPEFDGQLSHGICEYHSKKLIEGCVKKQASN